MGLYEGVMFRDTMPFILPSQEIEVMLAEVTSAKCLTQVAYAACKHQLVIPKHTGEEEVGGGGDKPQTGQMLACTPSCLHV